MRSLLPLVILVPLSCAPRDAVWPNADAPQTSGSGRGATLEGLQVHARQGNVRFDIPVRWREWHDDPRLGRNLHLTPSELDAVHVADQGDWDVAYSQIINAALPFGRCIAHVGGDGWGADSASYATIQLRAYVLTEPVATVVPRAQRGAAAAVREVDERGTVSVSADGPWQRVLVRYDQWHGDYGGTAVVDVRIRRFGDVTVAMAFLYVDAPRHPEYIPAILDSVRAD